MTTLSEDQIAERLAQAADIETQINKLLQDQDDLLNPIAQQYIAEINAPGADLAKCEQAVNRLPQGFHRTELRTALILASQKS